MLWAFLHPLIVFLLPCFLPPWALNLPAAYLHREGGVGGSEAGREGRDEGGEGEVVVVVVSDVVSARVLSYVV